MSAFKAPQAFPMATGNPQNGGDWVDGMDLRDWFAGQFLAGIASKELGGQGLSSIAENCYDMADTMIVARKVQS